MLYEHPLFGLHTYSRLRKQRFITNVKCAHLENKYLTQTCNMNTYKTSIYHKHAIRTLILQTIYLKINI